MNTTSELVFDAFKELLWDQIVSSALTKLFQRFAFLSWGPIQAAITWIVFKYADELYQAVKMYIKIELIIFKNKELQNKFAVASLNLKLVAQENGINSKEFKEGRDAHKKALEPFVRYDRVRNSA